MGIEIGKAAPDFSLYASDFSLWSLGDHRGTPVVLLFFPGAFSSVCTDELATVSNDLDEYDALGARLVGISTDSTVVLAEFKKVNQIAFPLLSDHNADVARTYGAKYNRDFTPMKLDRIAKRSAFVIDGEGRVRYAEVLDDADAQPDFDAVKAALRSLA